jgi:hypothetical protein
MALSPSDVISSSRHILSHRNPDYQVGSIDVEAAGDPAPGLGMTVGSDWAVFHRDSAGAIRAFADDLSPATLFFHSSLSPF